MLKKIIIVTIGVVILTGVEVLYAQEKPQARPGRRQAVESRQRRWGDVERPRREQAGRDDKTEHSDAAIRRIRREIRKIEQQLKAIKQKVNTRADAPKRRPRQSMGRLKAKFQETEKQEKAKEGMRGDWVGRLQQPRRGLNLPMLQGGRWLDNLTKAYRENDRQKMGQLIRRMHQQRQQWRTSQPGSMRRWGKERCDWDEQAPRLGRMGGRGQGRGIWDEEAPRPGRMGGRGQGRSIWDEEAPRPGRMGRRGQGRGIWDEEAPRLGRMGRRGQGRGIWDEEAPRPGRMGGRGQGRSIWDEEAPRPGRVGRRGQGGIPEQDEPESTEQDQWPEIE
ncbi:MAG: hypothetical protein PVJ60_04620 [Phycisphaerales bacterium]